ncbi:flagellin [Maritalea sp. P4.10X]|uniref:Flagellin n=2 Tax=Maritalea mediterranea TaxID=2909667 RepID=A0ABS9E9F1_9HYPH|nr:flagellin [Maritalea mediterranea]MCF4098829.1 flagellin [Maritalea mediterranea]
MTMIHLSAAVRQNLLSLQGTADLMSKTQNRLATGLKVNSALDNPNSFFTASALNNRASDLGGLLDDMGQGVQTLKAADDGIQAITKLVEAAKGKANQALQSNKVADRRRFAQEYNDLLGQIEDLAKDAGYKGKNLLAGAGNDLQVTFNEDGTSSVTISAVDYTDTSGALGLADLTVGTSGTLSITESALEAGDEAGDTLDVQVGGSTVATIDYGAGTTAEDVITALNAIDGVTASTDGTTISITSENGDIVIDDSNTTADLATQTGSGYAQGSFDTDTSVNTSLASLNTALNTLRSQASTFGTNLTVVENRQNFTKRLINTLEEGAGKLTLADTNEEGANLLALQTRQQLASTSLSFASQADQAVLRLFG